MSLPPFNPRRYPELSSLLGEDIVDPDRCSLADEAHDRILLRIVRGELAAGTELKSTRLAEDLGMYPPVAWRPMPRVSNSFGN
jgi:hypothetical protein